MTVKLTLLIAVFVLGLALCLWLILGRGPRRQRAFRRAQRLLEEGGWAEALAIVKAIQAEPRLAPVWQERLGSLAGESHQQAADHLLKEKRFEEALQHALDAAPGWDWTRKNSARALSRRCWPKHAGYSRPGRRRRTPGPY